MMEVEELLARAHDSINVKRVYGEPYEKDGLTIIPAAVVAGGGGGGGGEDAQGAKGSGSGFGVGARPVGAWVIKDGTISWQPAIDMNRVLVTAVLVLVLLRSMTRRRGRRRAKRS